VVLTVAGGGGGGNGQNVGRGFISMTDWDDRAGDQNTAEAITNRATKAMSGFRDLEFYALQPPIVRGLGQATGFQAELQNTGGLSREEFAKVRDQVLADCRADKRLANVRLTNLPDQPTLKISTDTQKLQALGITAANVNNTLSTAWGGTYVNDFVDRDRVKRVYVMGDGPFRSRPEDLNNWHVRGGDGQMVPFSTFASASWGKAPTSLLRFNAISNYEFSGQPAAGYSSGDSMNAFQEIADKYPGVGVAWSGTSYQERLAGGQAPILYGVSLIVVFLCLAALYESWSVPVAVLLVIPLGLVGAIAMVTLRGLENDVYLQIGLTTTMGLAAKNAILMIEFAEAEVHKGKGILEARSIRPGSACAHPDDVLRLHLRRAAAGSGPWRGRQCAHRHRHGGDRRHADGDGAGGVLHPAVLRADPPDAEGAVGSCAARRAARRRRLRHEPPARPYGSGRAGASAAQAAPKSDGPLPIPAQFPSGPAYGRPAWSRPRPMPIATCWPIRALSR
jgi:multidrug efflux pump subunit AcrB